MTDVTFLLQIIGHAAQLTRNLRSAICQVPQLLRSLIQKGEFVHKKQTERATRPVPFRGRPREGGPMAVLEARKRPQAWPAIDEQPFAAMVRHRSRKAAAERARITSVCPMWGET